MDNTCTSTLSPMLVETFWVATMAGILGGIVAFWLTTAWRKFK